MLNDHLIIPWILKALIKIFDVCSTIIGNHKNSKTDNATSITLFRDNFVPNIHCKYDILGDTFVS